MAIYRTLKFTNIKFTFPFQHVNSVNPIFQQKIVRFLSKRTEI